MSEEAVVSAAMDRARGQAVAVTGLVVEYDDLRAVDDVSFSIAPGSTAAVVGPSGSGKSSLLRAIAGLEPVAAGTVSLFGVDQVDAPPNERGLGLMFQDHVLFPHLDVAGNVAFGLKMQRVGETSIDARVDEVLETVGLAGFANRSIETLSGGEAQRVALARSLAPSPKVLMLDEPLGSLDRVLREGLVRELRALFAELELTVIHVTHDQQEAFSLADEVIVMRKGRIEQVGPPAEIWHRPVSWFVASFLGHQNIWQTADGPVLAPLPALSVVDEHTVGAIEAEVSDAEFREGRHRLIAIEARPTSDEPRRFVVESDHHLRVDRGAHIHIAIDPSRLVALDDDRD